VSVTTAKGGYCPEGTGKGESVVDMIPSAMATRDSVQSSMKANTALSNSGYHSDKYNQASPKTILEGALNRYVSTI
jgi:hypothetical protein